MITVQQILSATNGGLDIILSLYPQAQKCVGQKNKHFAIRNEKTPSAAGLLLRLPRASFTLHISAQPWLRT